MSLNGNWVDLVILIVLAYFIFSAFKVGLWVVLADFASFLLSLVIALRFYPIVSEILRDNFDLTRSIANALGFLVVAVATEIVLGSVFGKLITKIPPRAHENIGSKILAAVAGAGQGLVLIAFILTLFLTLPISPQIKSTMAESKIGGEILGQTSGIESKLTEVFGGMLDESLTYLTIKPESNETVPLTVNEYNLVPDTQAEVDLFNMVNQERAKAGVGQLIWEESLVPVGRAHATDMWQRKYFAHVSPDGEDVGGRLRKNNISYTYAGENLALAPTTPTAHTGLMNSEGHKRNILDPEFKKIGIGVIDNGYYGKMYVQVFTD